MPFATLNAHENSAVTFSNGDRTVTAQMTGGEYAVRGTIARGGAGGKWYFEMLLGAGCSSSRAFQVGVMGGATSLATGVGKVTPGASYDLRGYKYLNGSYAGSYITATTGDVIGVAWDSATGKIWWAKNNIWMQSGDPAAGTNPMYSSSTLIATLYPALSFYGPHVTPNTLAMTARLLSTEFSYAPPTGFTAWGDAPVAVASHLTELGDGGGDAVVFLDATTKTIVDVVATPAASDGAWTASVPPGAYYVVYLKANCQPLCHGPYTLS